MNTSVRLLVEELERRNIPVELVPLKKGKSLVYFTYNNEEHALTGTSSDLTSRTGSIIANNKIASEVLARRLGMVTPDSIEYNDISAAISFLDKHKEVVVKPFDAAHGDGVTTSIKTEKKLKIAIKRASKLSARVIIQQHVTGTDLRVLIVGGEVAAVAERVAAHVVGDGLHNVRNLIKIENQNSQRGDYYEKPLNKIKMDTVKQFLGAKSLRRIPKQGEYVQVVGTANIGSGGYAVNRTGKIPDEICRQSKLFAQAANMFTCGVDFMYDEVKGVGHFIEANGSPSFGLHLWPKEGDPINVVKVFVDALLAAYDAKA